MLAIKIHKLLMILFQSLLLCNVHTYTYTSVYELQYNTVIILQMSKSITNHVC